MKDADNSFSNMLPNKMKINLNMFGTLMLYGIGAHVDGSDVVVVNQGSPANKRMQLN